MVSVETSPATKNLKKNIRMTNTLIKKQKEKSGMIEWVYLGDHGDLLPHRNDGWWKRIFVEDIFTF